MLRIVIVLIVVVMAAAVGVGGVSKLEENDAFCASCHRAPEVAYVSRAAQAVDAPDNAPDLASAHAPVPMRCVDCHRGDGSLFHRGVSLALGARNATLFLLGRGTEGTTRFLWLPETSCTACHADVWAEEGFEKHFHNLLPEYHALPQVVRAPTNRILCVRCHPAHRPGEALTGFVDEGVVLPVCETCHRVWGKGPQRMGR